MEVVAPKISTVIKQHLAKQNNLKSKNNLYNLNQMIDGLTIHNLE